jgi:TonB family protein
MNSKLYIQKYKRYLIAFGVATGINGMLFICIPLLHLLAGGPPKKEKISKVVESTIDAYVPQRVEDIDKKPIKALRSIAPPSKPAQAISREFKLDLSVANGGEGVAINTGGQGAFVYSPGDVDVEPQIIGNPPPPRIPLRAKNENVSGFVTVQWIVNEFGRVTEINVLREEPMGYGFGKEARRYLKTLRFKPASVQGAPVRCLVKQTIDWN